ncbi:MAG: transposase, partial [Deltaproteobacteria bacterium]|nr:transposase [Deltaproteobacteria bacterium]
MDYFKILNLNREPFSNSPDPEYFFQSRQHLGCLQKVELALRLRRGLNVVIGDIGTGKTTLCRQLIRRFVN